MSGENARSATEREWRAGLWRDALDAAMRTAISIVLASDKIAELPAFTHGTEYERVIVGEIVESLIRCRGVESGDAETVIGLARRALDRALIEMDQQGDGTDD